MRNYVAVGNAFDVCVHRPVMCRREGYQVLVSTLLEECGNCARSLDAVRSVNAL